MSEDIITLNDFRAAHLELLSNWLTRPHVKLWYPNPDEDIAYARDLCALVDDGDQVAGQFLIAVNDQPTGYIRWQLVPKSLLDEIGLADIPGNSADVDLLIGEPALVRRGLGGEVLAGIEDKLRTRGDVPAVGLTTNKENRYAHRAFEKSGYRVAAEYSPDGYGSCYLYIKKL